MKNNISKFIAHTHTRKKRNKALLFIPEWAPWFEFKKTKFFRVVKCKNFVQIKKYIYAYTLSNLFNYKKTIFVVTDLLVRVFANEKQIKIICNLFKKYKIKSIFYFADTLYRYDTDFQKPFNRDAILNIANKFDHILTYCESDAKKYNLKYLPLPFKYKNPNYVNGLKYDLSFVANVVTLERGKIIIKLIDNRFLKKLKSFFYPADLIHNFFKNTPEEKYFKYEPLSNSIALQEYFIKSNTILYLIQKDDFPFSLRDFCVKNNKKILTNSKVTYDLLNEPNKVRYIEDMSKFSEEDAKWCKEVDHSPYSQHCFDLCDETKFAESIIKVISENEK